jgi:hypothetical protein
MNLRCPFGAESRSEGGALLWMQLGLMSFGSRGSYWGWLDGYAPRTQTVRQGRSALWRRADDQEKRTRKKRRETRDKTGHQGFRGTLCACGLGTVLHRRSWTRRGSHCGRLWAGLRHLQDGKRRTWSLFRVLRRGSVDQPVDTG